MGKNGDISLRLVPNQALYQAEPQPEMDLLTGHAEDGAPLTSRILPQMARISKIMEHLQGATAWAAVFGVDGWEGIVP